MVKLPFVFKHARKNINTTFKVDKIFWLKKFDEEKTWGLKAESTQDNWFLLLKYSIFCKKKKIEEEVNKVLKCISTVNVQ